jgi:hypothetical protein
MSRGHCRIVIDFAFNAFRVAGSLEDFPRDPGQRARRDASGLFDVPSVELPVARSTRCSGRSGSTRSATRRPPWLIPGHRYRLRRWPSLSGIPVSLIRSA